MGMTVRHWKSETGVNLDRLLGIAVGGGGGAGGWLAAAVATPARRDVMREATRGG